MAYRISVENQDGKYHQLLGNNESYQPLIDYLELQGCEMDEDGCFHDFEITDLPKVIEILMEHLKEKDKELIEDGHGGIYNLTPNDEERKWLASTMQIARDWSYVFLIANFIDAFRNDVESVRFNGKATYNVKNGHKLFISGY